MSSTPAFGIYVHWPFCAQKCPYCDFNSHVRHKGWDEKRFLAAYLRELDHVAGLIGTAERPRLAPAPLPVAPVAAGRTVSSIFFGGGTPSLMQPATTAAILDRIAKLWPIATGAEITLEANPGSVEAQRFAGYKAAGVNRVSMGLQSLRDDQLKKLGRIHTVAEAKAALAIARRTFQRTSFDLIYARPGQTPAAWRAELAEALEMAEGHVSLYQLTIEPDTPYEALHRAGKLVVPDADAALALYEITQEQTAAAGLPAYEISNHAARGEESRHNLLYWRYGEYAGVGPGAHGRLIYGGARHATVAERAPEAWAAQVESHGHGLSQSAPLTRTEEADEMLLMGLRLQEGLELGALAEVGGVQPSAKAIGGLVELGLIESAAEISARADSSKEAAFPGEIRGCIGPAGSGEWADMSTSSGVSPKDPLGLTASRIRATPRGRFVLNEVVRQLSLSFEPAAPGPR